MPITTYSVISSSTADGLKTQITTAIAQGSQPLGAPVYANGRFCIPVVVGTMDAGAGITAVSVTSARDPYTISVAASNAIGSGKQPMGGLIASEGGYLTQYFCVGTPRSENGVYTVTVTLTRDEINALNTTPYQLIPSPGVGKLAVVQFLTAYTDGGVEYATGADIFLYYGSAAGSPVLEATTNIPGTSLTAGGGSWFTTKSFEMDSQTELAGATDTAIVLATGTGYTNTMGVDENDDPIPLSNRTLTVVAKYIIIDV